MPNKVRAKSPRSAVPTRAPAKRRIAPRAAGSAKAALTKAAKVAAAEVASAKVASAKVASAKAPSAPASSAPVPEPLITRSELRRVLVELASTLAPGDVGDLLGEEQTLRARASTLGGKPGEVFRTQLDLALACLHDHAAGEIPQIPFYTISLLTAAVAYLADDLDIIPDFLPDRGTIDDALVLAMACSMGESGLRRYCTWKEIDANAALGLAPAPARGARTRSANR